MLIFLEIGQSATGQHLVTLDQLKGPNIGGRGQPYIERLLVVAELRAVWGRDSAPGVPHRVSGWPALGKKRRHQCHAELNQIRALL
jgi:hypothetical protein